MGDIFLIMIFYWTLNGEEKIAVGGKAPTQVTCEKYGAEGVKHFKGQGAIEAYSRCVPLEPKPAGLPDYTEQPKVPRRDA